MPRLKKNVYYLLLFFDIYYIAITINEIRTHCVRTYFYFV